MTVALRDRLRASTSHYTDSSPIHRSSDPRGSEMPRYGKLPVHLMALFKHSPPASDVAMTGQLGLEVPFLVRLDDTTIMSLLGRCKSSRPHVQ